jgi:hypothetical protein
LTCESERGCRRVLGFGNWPLCVWSILYTLSMFSGSIEQASS